MMAYRCFLCSARIGRKHIMHASYFDGRRHVVRLCYGCGMPDFEEKDIRKLSLKLMQSTMAVDAKLREIKTLEPK